MPNANLPTRLIARMASPYFLHTHFKSSSQEHWLGGKGEGRRVIKRIVGPGLDTTAGPGSKDWRQVYRQRCEAQSEQSANRVYRQREGLLCCIVDLGQFAHRLHLYTPVSNPVYGERSLYRVCVCVCVESIVWLLLNERIPK